MKISPENACEIISNLFYRILYDAISPNERIGGQYSLSLSGVAKYLHVTPKTARSYVKLRGLPCYKIGRRYTFRLEEVDAWQESYRKNAVVQMKSWLSENGMWDGLTASPEHIVWVDAETKMTLAEAKREQRPLLTSNYPYKLF